ALRNDATKAERGEHRIGPARKQYSGGRSGGSSQESLQAGPAAQHAGGDVRGILSGRRIRGDEGAGGQNSAGPRRSFALSGALGARSNSDGEPRDYAGWFEAAFQAVQVERQR